MEGIPSLVEQMTPTTFLLVGITGSLVLVVVIGGLTYLRRYYNRPAPVVLEAEEATQPTPAAAVAAYREQISGEDYREWENRLGEKLAELETRFAAFAEKLGRIGAIDGDSAEVARVLNERGMSREDLLAPPSGPNGSQPTSQAVVNQLRLSEEQIKLVQRLAGKNQSHNVVGA